MSRLVWHKPDARTYQTGVDRGVLYPSNGPAVPWNGLIDVTEKGNQEQTSFKRDGITYLTKVSHREFSASISAFTFPDAFADIVGIAEAADGLFLDSQAPDNFDLSYRTLISDGKDYRIHLIYGATAALSDVGFSTLSDSVTPSTFDFEITCTPQKVSGYRPTGHVIIDTRSVDPVILADLEDLIYGGFNQEAALPSVETLMNMMNYGDEVIITDNGDGTWTAEGSYRNVVENPDGTFFLDNIAYLDHAPVGDGIYTIGSTGETLIDPGTDEAIDEPLDDTI